MTREEKQKAIDTLKISAPIMAVTQEEFNDYIQTLNKIMDWLEQESIIKNDLGVDAVNRKAVKEQMIKYGFHAPDMTVTEFVEDLPSVTPQEPTTGHWMKSNIGGAKVCSVCNAHMGLSSFKFCPSCGAKMVEPQESEG